MKLPIISLVLLIVSGCSILPKQQPSALHDFGIPYPTTSSKITVLADQQLSVTVEAPKWLVDNRVHYRLLYSSPTQVRFYVLDRWIAPPPELFEQLLNSSRGQWRVPVLIRLYIFEQQFVSSTHANVVMHFSAITLPDDKNQKPIKQDFYLQTPCPSPDAKGAVIGFTSLTKEAVVIIENWLKEIK